ncbi:MAG: alanine--tRNA ligase, partial [Paramuribaculum sp.]|nr:alanine--tRNA ligase [Paramuribaculum sp.]
AQAVEMGAMALFGEKYGDEVRVIKYGDSNELCGGTHVDNTGNIGMIRIISESSIAAGIRRIEAITAERVEDAVDEMTRTLHEIGSMLNNAPDILGALKRSIAENAELHKEVEEYFRERIKNLADDLLSKAQVSGDIKLVTLTGIRVPDVVKNVAFAVRAASPEATAFVGATIDVSGKPLLTVMLTDDVVARGLNASQLVREAARKIKGGGGGQPGFAQAGGKDASGISEAFEALVSAIK